MRIKLVVTVLLMKVVLLLAYNRSSESSTDVKQEFLKDFIKLNNFFYVEILCPISESKCKLQVTVQ